MEGTQEITWDAPGAGSWVSMADHFPGAITPAYASLNMAATELGMSRVFERYGAPVRKMATRLVNGHVYMRIEPLIMADKDAGPPPAPLLWLVTRLHPEFRRRNRIAARVLAERPWLDATREWDETQRSEREQRNLALQDEDPAAMTDAELVEHLERVKDNVFDGHVLHFELHGPDLAPIGFLIVAGQRWGIPPGDLMASFTGWSPASSAPARALARLGALVAESGTDPQSLDDVRALGPEAAAALDEYLRHRGWHMISRYDVDGLTLGELPSLVLSGIRAADTPPRSDRADAALGALLERVPAADRPELERLVTEARAAYGLRDENGPYNVTWPNGLLRRALLEAGRRLTDRGSLDRREHAFEMEVAETQALLDGAPGPTAADVAERAARRARWSAAAAPSTLGRPDVAPPTEPMPAPLRRVTEAVVAAFTNLGTAPGAGRLRGLGVGDRAYVGRARVARTPEEALALLEPGEILVTPMTTPAYNAVLPLAGAVIVEEGGALCHAAIIARELDIPAIVGVSDALEHIHDGDLIEVDPVAGAVSAVEADEVVTG